MRNLVVSLGGFGGNMPVLTKLVDIVRLLTMICGAETLQNPFDHSR